MSAPSPVVPVAAASDFSLANLPYGSFRRGSSSAPRLGVALGDHVVDLSVLDDAGLLPALPSRAASAPNLDALLAAGPQAWQALRERLLALLSGADPDLVAADRVRDAAVVPRATTHPCLPFTVRDFVDFYASLEHATNLGRLFRPGVEPLLPNWRHLPIGYHGRASTVVVSGTPIRRPCGQLPYPAGPVWGPTRALDVELELGFVTGAGNPLGEPIPVDGAAERIFGFVLVNDWSARDIQRWEYQPLGPFLGKSFATSISPWVVPLAALEPHRVAPPRQEPEPLPYLRAADPWVLDVALELALVPAGGPLQTIARTNARTLYWTPAQQLAHATSNGATAGAGDLFASGTISGSARDSYGSLIELTWNGERPLELDGERRTYLEDGDTVVITGRAGGEDGAARVGFGEVSGSIVPA